MAIAGVLLPQSHGGHHRGRPAEVALPVFSCVTPPQPDRDFERPYEPLVLALTAAWSRMPPEDRSAEQAGRLAPPLVDLLGGRPRPRLPPALRITWPLQPSQPHTEPSRHPG